MKGLSSFIPPPAPSFSAQPQQLTQLLPSLPDNFKDIESVSSSDNTGSDSNLGARKQKDQNPKAVHMLRDLPLPCPSTNPETLNHF